MEQQTILLKAEGITKRFAGMTALNKVQLTVYPGKVNVLLGENGAGKSTLVKIISGVYIRDEGDLWLNGEKVEFANVKEAQKAGISIIHQELNMLPERTIAQNIFLGREPMKTGGIVDYKKMVMESRKLLNNLGLDLNPNSLVKNLSIAQQQMVEVTKALSFNLKLLIMDEPTSSLTKNEIDKLFEIVDRLKSQGIGIIYISHRMDELLRVGDQITIMRDGEYIDCVDTDHIDMDEVVSKMVGRKIEKLYNRRWNEPGAVVLRTESLCGIRLRNVNIEVRKGEIVSLSGLVGAGRTEVAKAIFGYDPVTGGKYFFNGKEITRPTPKKSVRMGMAFLPEDRKNEGLLLRKSIKENVVSAGLFKFFPKGLLNDRREAEIAERYRNELKIATTGVEKLAGELSGGNQQKVVIGKWLATGNQFFIFDEPTRGIDVGAKAEIYQLLDHLAAEGAAILMISSEMNEVIGLSDRVYVMYEGEIMGEFSHEEVSQEAIVAKSVGGVKAAKKG
ncbi:sugar ABC transporter ATP-binding protein [Clostridium sp. AM58-1XD]|uniref:sugar ABC transporter ATP-binding protein n=1 Tax=Clostridium sp. AM58-1XD TaxID=2292307 RepID=UPI001FA81F71|nr:sugar ABC transporter ATP-binding protein [Clostridium sp. AM58-1XD]